MKIEPKIAAHAFPEVEFRLKEPSVRNFSEWVALVHHQGLLVHFLVKSTRFSKLTGGNPPVPPALTGGLVIPWHPQGHSGQHRLSTPNFFEES